MESGQGVINVKFKKPSIIEKLNAAIYTEVPGLHIIKIEPEIAWEKKPLPTKLPANGLHGGIIFNKHEFKTENQDNKEIIKNNEEIFVQGVGFGSGGIVASGTGPVLIGIGSTVPVISIWLLCIVILLLITAIFWAVTNLCPKCLKRSKITRHSKRKNSNWVHEMLEKDEQLYNKNISPLKGNMQLSLTEQDIKGSVLNESRLMITPAPSLQNYNRSIRHSMSQSTKGSILKATSTSSILSYNSTMVGSGIYGTLSLFQTQTGLKINQIAVSRVAGVIFTVSEKSCPNTYMREDMVEFSFCQPASYNECVQLILMCEETILIGKMKNKRDNLSDNPFVIQTWSTVDGTIFNDGLESFPCVGMCSVRDEYLVVLSMDNVSVINLLTKRCLSQIKSPLTTIKHPQATLSIQSTNLMDHLVLSEFLSSTLSIYVYDFENILKMNEINPSKYLMNNSLSFGLVSSSQLIVALNTSEVILWDFLQNTETLVYQSSNQKIQKLLPSSTGRLVIIQFPTSISIVQTNDWIEIFNIPVCSDQISTVAFSSHIGDNNFLAIALDNGTIRIYHSFSGQLIKTVKISTPVTFLMFDDLKDSFFILSDRASHYRINVLSVA